VRRELIGALVLLALVFILSLLVPHAVEQTPPTRGSDDVAGGGYAAWYELLAREGVHVTRFHARHAELGAEGIDTLILAFPAQGVEVSWDGAERDAIDAWVRAGGVLVAIGPAPRVGREAGEHTAAVGEDEANHAPVAPTRIAPMDVSVAPAGLQTVTARPGALRGPWAQLVGALAARGDARIVAPPGVHATTLLADHAGALVVRYREGLGEVVAIASAVPFENGSLAHGDDARLAYLVAAPARAGALVAFDEAVRGEIVDRPWYRALDVRERLALVFLALAGLAWLAYGFLPLGPAVTLRATREPTSEEFVDAFAALYGRAHARGRASDALLSDAARRLERAPATPTNVQLAAQLATVRAQPPTDDRALLALAVLTRSVREETTRGRDPDRRAGPLARRVSARRRRR